MKLHLPTGLRAALLAAVAAVSAYAEVPYTGTVYTWDNTTSGNDPAFGRYAVTTYDAAGNPTVTTQYVEGRSRAWADVQNIFASTSITTGNTMRFDSSHGQNVKELTYTFFPFTVGGFIVEKGAVGYSITSSGSASRIFYLGNNSDVPAYSEFNEDFSINKTSGSDGVVLRGTQTWQVASGATFTLQSNNNFSLTGDLTTAGDGLVSFTTGNLNVAGGATLTFNSDVSVAHTLTLDVGDLTAEDGPILTGSGSLSIGGLTLDGMADLAVGSYTIASTTNANAETIKSFFTDTEGYKLINDNGVLTLSVQSTDGPIPVSGDTNLLYSAVGTRGYEITHGTLKIGNANGNGAGSATAGQSFNYGPITVKGDTSRLQLWSWTATQKTLLTSDKVGIASGIALEDGGMLYMQDGSYHFSGGVSVKGSGEIQMNWGKGVLIEALTNAPGTADNELTFRCNANDGSSHRIYGILSDGDFSGSVHLANQSAGIMYFSLGSQNALQHATVNLGDGSHSVYLALDTAAVNLKGVSGAGTIGLSTPLTGHAQIAASTLHLTGAGSSFSGNIGEGVTLAVDSGAGLTLTGTVGLYNTITCEGSLTLDPDVVLDLSHLSYTEDAYGGHVYRLASLGGNASYSGYDALTLDSVTGAFANLATFNPDGTIVLSLGAPRTVDWDANWGVDGPDVVAANLKATTALVTSPFVTDGNVTAGLVGSGNSEAFIFGVQNGDVDNTGMTYETDVWIEAAEGSYRAIVGGSYCNNWNGGGAINLEGDTHIQVNGATVGTIVGGNLKDGKSPQFTGSSYISVFDGDVTASIIGSSTNSHNKTTTQTGDTNIFVYVPLSQDGVNPLPSGGGGSSVPANHVIGASAHVDNTSGSASLIGSTHITIDLSGYTGDRTEFVKSVVGGHFSDDAIHTQTIDGNTNVTIKGGDIAFSGDIIGGNRNHNGSSSISGKSTLNIEGGTYSGTITGGSVISGNATSTIGNVVLNLGGDAQINGNVYAAGVFDGSGSSTVSSTTVNLGAGVEINGILSGDFGGDSADLGSVSGDLGFVYGDRTLKFTDAVEYNNLSNAVIEGFDELYVADGGIVTINQLTIIDKAYPLDKSGDGTLVLEGTDNVLFRPFEVHGGKLVFNGTFVLDGFVPLLWEHYVGGNEDMNGFYAAQEGICVFDDSFGSVEIGENAHFMFQGEDVKDKLVDGSYWHGPIDYTTFYVNEGTEKVSTAQKSAELQCISLAGGTTLKVDADIDAEFLTHSLNTSGTVTFDIDRGRTLSGTVNQLVDVSITGSVDLGGSLSLVSSNGTKTITAENADVVLRNGSLSGDLTLVGGSLDADGVRFTTWSSLSVANAGNVSFRNASNSSYGGAIDASSLGNTVSFTGNESVTFSGNSVMGLDSCGGAIDAEWNTISFTGNGAVTFSGNTASCSGGAISSWAGHLLLNENDSLVFDGNCATGDNAYGGAIDIQGDLHIRNNGEVVFTNNRSAADKNVTAAVSVWPNQDVVRIQGNDHVLFRGNGFGIALEGEGELALSAGHGQSIEMYDMMYLRYAGAMFNSSYTDAAGNLQRGEGDILISGRYLDEDYGWEVGELSIHGTPFTVEKHTTHVEGMSTLYAGRLSIEDGVVYEGGGFAVAAGADATLSLRNASMAMVIIGYHDVSLPEVAISGGSTLDLQGVNTITAATLDMKSGSTLAFTLDPAHADTAVLTLDGTFNQGGALTISLAADGTLQDGDEYLLLSLTSQTTPASWNPANVTVTGMDGVSTDALSWDSGNLYFSYGETLPLTWNGWHGNIWNTTDANWTRNGQSVSYRNGREVVFDNTGVYGEVELQGELSPAGVLVDNALAHDYTFTGSGKLTGDMQLTKDGQGSLTVNTDNDYTGGTILNAGTLVAGSATAFGTGTIQINGGTLDLGGNVVYAPLAFGDGVDASFINGTVAGDLIKSGGSLSVARARVFADSDVQLTAADSIRFEQNDIYATGAALSADSVVLYGNKEVAFDSNSAYTMGGAILGLTTDISKNDSVLFRSNSASASDEASFGGAVLGEDVTINENGRVEFSSNTVATSNADAVAGAIFGTTVRMNLNGEVVFNQNLAASNSRYSLAGAVHATDSFVMDGNAAVSFIGNSAHSIGDDTIAFGGAVYGPSISLTNNDSVVFSANSSVGHYSAFGGALCGDDVSTVSVDGNGSVSFMGNIAQNSYDMPIFSIIGSEEGAVGGAIYGRTVSLNNNESVEFVGNGAVSANAAAWGGAIKGSIVSLCGNGNVEFRKNFEKEYDTAYPGENTPSFRLRSVTVSGDDASLNLAAGAGHSITFYDTLLAFEGSKGTPVSFNAAYQDKDGLMQDATGDIVFSGAHAEEDLRELNPSYTQSGLMYSLTSEVYATTNLYGGRLRIEDGAVYKGYAINVTEGSNATLRLSNGNLSQADYTNWHDVTLASGTTLDLQGANSITANTLDMQSGSTLAFTLDPAHADTAILTLDGTFNQGGALTISLAADGTLQEGDEILLMSLSGTTTPGSWNKNLVTVTGLGANINNLSWEDGGLYFTYGDIPLPEGYWWTGASSMTWNTSAVNWTYEGQSVAYSNGVDVAFGDERSGWVELQGELAPASVLVDNGSGHGYIFSGSGKLTGDMQLTKDGKGTLTIYTANDYTGGTILNAGTLVAGNSKAFGTATIQINGGTLNLGGYALSNKVTAENADVVLRNGSLSGDISIAGGSLDANGVSFTTTSLTVANAGDVSFLNASSSSNGGAICAYSSSTVNFTENGTLTFSGNSSSYGGAIYAYSSTVSFTENGTLTFSGNSTISSGGAIEAYSSTVSFAGNEAMMFSENSSSSGGAIYAVYSSTVSFAGNEAVTFSENSATSTGGAIYAYSSTVSFTENEIVTFSENSAKNGGGIFADGTVSFTDNGAVTFSKNTATSSGGAIESRGSVSFTENEIVTFSENSAKYGGGIYADDNVSFAENGTVTFSGNSASTYGGAIRASSSSTVSFTGNEAVTFRGNYEKTGSEDSATYRLRSVYVYGGTLKLAAGEGQNITFYDTLYADSSATLSLNAQYEDKDGVQHDATGDIVFSGKFAENDLAALKADYTAQELTDSLTSVVYSTTNLYGGRLRIEDGANYKGNGINVAAGSNATLRLADGTLDQAGYDVTLASGSTLDLQGVNTITANTLDVKSGSTLAFTLDPAHADTAILTLDGTFNQGGALTISLAADGTLQEGDEFLLMSLSGTTTPASWNKDLVTVTGLGANIGNLSWEDGGLYFTYGDIPLPDVYRWTGANSMTWNTSTVNWTLKGQSVAYRNGVEVLFGNTRSGTVTLSGALSPQSVLVDNDAEHGYTFTGSGKLTGDMQLTKEGEGTLTVNTENDYTGGTLLSGGTLVMGNENAFGTGPVVMNGGTLDLGGGHLDTEDIVFTPGAEIGLRNGVIGYHLDDFSIQGARGVHVDGLHVEARNLTIANSGEVSFTNSDTVYDGSGYSIAYGGAMYGDESITMTDNETLTFSGNSIVAGYGYAYGGAVFSGWADEVDISRNGSVRFVGNSVSVTGVPYGVGGGAIYCESDLLFLNENDSLVFDGNSASGDCAYGGAIALYGAEELQILNNGEVAFTNNRNADAQHVTAAVSGTVDDGVRIQGNDHVLFRGNGFGIALGWHPDATLALSAGRGQSIEMYDMMYVDDGDVSLNSSYTDAAGNLQRGEGDILISGKYLDDDYDWDVGTLIIYHFSFVQVEKHTTHVGGMSTLYAGRLSIEDGAVYEGGGFTVADAADATLALRNASMVTCFDPEYGGSYVSEDVSISGGSTLALQGVNSITAESLNMADGSTLSFTLGVENVNDAALTLTGLFNQGGALTINLQSDFPDETCKLISMTSGEAPESWDKSRITLTGEDTDVRKLQWEDGVLYYLGSLPRLETATWSGAASMAWNSLDKNWTQGEYSYRYRDGVDVVFGNTGAAGEVELAGKLAPLSVLVDNDVEHGYAFTGSGKLTGDMQLTKDGAGTLSISTANDYTGGTVLNGGTLATASATALGGGDLLMQGGRLRVEQDLTLEGQITVDGLEDSSIEVADGAVLHLSQAIINDGFIRLSGDIDISALEGTPTGTTYYGGGQTQGNGFLMSECETLLIECGLDGDFDWSGAEIRHSGNTVVKEDWGGVIFAVPDTDAFYIFKDTESVSAAHSFTPDTRIVMSAGTTLNVDADISLAQIQANGAATIDIDSGSVLTGYATGTGLTLAGDGVYALESGTTLGSLSLGSNWTGTVRLTGSASGANFNSMARTGSRLELNGVYGYPTTYNGTTTADIILTDTADGTAAFTATYGNSYNDGYNMKFTGAIRGEGTFVANAGANRYQNYELAGDVSGWRGEFRYASGQDTVLTISGNAHEVNAAINGGSGLTLQVKTDSAFGAAVSAGSLVLNGGSATFNDSIRVGGGISASGTSTLAVGQGHTLSLGTAISNSGSLTLRGTFDVSGHESELIGSEYSGGAVSGNGFGATLYGVHAVQNSGSATLDWSQAKVLYDAVEREKRADGSVVLSRENDGMFHVLKGTESVGTAQDAAAAAGITMQGIELQDGTTLEVDRDFSTEPVSVVSGSAYLNVMAGATLQSNGEVREELSLKGDGTFKLAAGSTQEDISWDGADWHGTVLLSDVAIQDLDLNEFGHAGSKVGLDGVSGNFARPGAAFAPTLVLTGDGLQITACYTGASYTFAGGVEGDGNWIYGLTGRTHNQTYIFTGDMSRWTGAYESVEADKTSTLKFYGDAAEMGADIRQTAGTVNVEVGNGSAEHTTAFKGEVEASSFTVKQNATAVLENKATVTGSVKVDGTLEVAEGGSLALAEAAAMSVGNAYTVTGQGGNAPALSGNIKADAFGFHGAEDHTARIDNVIVDLQAEASVVFDNVILGATSRLTDDPATVVANNLVIEGQYGVNVQEGEPMTIKSGSIMQRLGQPSELIELDSDASACRLDITNVENVSITGNCLTIDLSGMYPALQDYSRKFDWLGISLGSGDQVAALDTNMVVELKLNDRLHPRAYYLSGVGWGGTDFVMPVANGENVGMIYVCMFDVPEPATSTLSLLALAALAARRRRKH